METTRPESISEAAKSYTHRFLEEKDRKGSDQRDVPQQRLHHHSHHSMKLNREKETSQMSLLFFSLR